MNTPKKATFNEAFIYTVYNKPYITIMNKVQKQPRYNTDTY